MDRFTGGCLCGNVRFVASGRPYRVGVCHCLDCRKHHGALFNASGGSRRMRSDRGETRDYDRWFFCPRCGSAVFGRWADEIGVNLELFDATDQLKPTDQRLIRRDCSAIRRQQYYINIAPALPPSRVSLMQIQRANRSWTHFRGSVPSLRRALSPHVLSKARTIFVASKASVRRNMRRSGRFLIEVEMRSLERGVPPSSGTVTHLETR